MYDAPMKPDFPELYERLFPRVYNYLVYALADAADAEDAAGAVFERALAGWASFDPARGPAEAWVFAIARNAVRDRYRARRRRSWLPLEWFEHKAEETPHAEEHLVRDESKRALVRAMKALDERERQVLALKFGAELSNVDIAAEQGLEAGHVGVIVHRALKRLQAALEKEERP